MLSLLLALTSPSLAQTVDTFGGTSGSNVGNFDYKLNTYDVTGFGTLDHIEVWVSGQAGFGQTDLTWVVYEQAPGGQWDLVWESVDTIGAALDWHISPAVNLTLVANRSYAIGYYAGFEDIEYFFESAAPLETVNWGSRTGAMFSGNGNSFFRPDPINDTISDLGYRQRLTVTELLDQDGDGWPETFDCDDGDPNINPGMAESCDGVDEDCDGVIDNDVVYTDWWPDADGDGYGEQGATPTSTCDGAPAGTVDNGRDCDDGNANVHPNAPESCDGIDEDCDGAIDNGVVYADWWPDADGDGFGDQGAAATSTCDGAPADTVDNDWDCDDSAATVYPDAPELCNEVDDDCDGEVDEQVVYVDWWPDDDGDGFGDASAVPVLDCAPPDGMVDNDGDCNDAVAVVNPDATELCDGLDNNCDEVLNPDEIDSDLDGALDCTDCDPFDAEIFPGAEESCNGIDNDCDGEIPTDKECNPHADESLSIGAACGCSSAPGSVSPLMLLALLGLVRRRR